MARTDRWNTEQAFHDRQARERAATFAAQPERLRFDDAAYLRHETWIEPAINRLGEVRGRHVLDIGCGHGMAAVVLARRGAHVTACDLSFGYLDEARSRARANGVDVQFVEANGNRLPFADGSFDRIWGNAVLHHLDIPMARELKRVLRPGGFAVLFASRGARIHSAGSGNAGTAARTAHRTRFHSRRILRMLREVFPRRDPGFQLGQCHGGSWRQTDRGRSRLVR